MYFICFCQMFNFWVDFFSEAITTEISESLRFPVGFITVTFIFIVFALVDFCILVFCYDFLAL